MEDGTNVYNVQVPLKLSVIRRIHAWMVLNDHLTNSSESIIKGFEIAGIKEGLKIEFSSEDPFADLDSYNFI